MRAFVERFFRVRERGSTVGTELLGGATTFITMAYIIVVNPAILATPGPDGLPGIPVEPSTVATIAAAVFGSLLMGLYANRPIAVAPYMGENAFIAFTLAGMGVTWQQRLGTVFVSGLAFLLLTLLGLRTWLANAVSASMKHSFAVGIGLFLLFVGLYETGIVVSGVSGMPVDILPKTAEGKAVIGPSIPPLKIGELHRLPVLLAVGGFLLMMALQFWNVRGGILLGIVVTAVVGYALGQGEKPPAVVALPWEEPYCLDQIALQLDVAGVLRFSFFPILLTLFLISFLDTLGTLVAVGSAGGMLDKEGNFPEIEKPMLVDSAACVFSALVGTSTSGAFIESATGIREGARTGLAAVTTALLFAVAVFFIPLVKPLQGMQFAYGPALMAVGMLMMGAVVNIKFDDLTEVVPAVATLTMMLFTFNIANGLTAGLVLYPLCKLLAGRVRDLHWGAVVLGGLCLIYFVFGLPH